jgi:acetyl-CoA carboxylase biotin carboxyl carrier protein
VSDALSALKKEDVEQLARLIESLEQSTFDFLQLQVGDMKVTIGKGAAPPAVGAPVVAAPAASAYIPPPQAAPPAAAAPKAAASGKRAISAASAGTVEIKSQIMGMFYAQSEPGTPPFVTIGAEVKEDTTVCLIEVMKTFNAMPAGVKGVITEICAENAQMVEYGQVLFRVRPS